MRWRPSRAREPDQFAPGFERPSISVKLSALHPRYEWIEARARVRRIAAAARRAGATQARKANLGLTVDAEESERLDLMLDVFEAMGEAEPLWRLGRSRSCGAGLSKRALPVIAWLGELARRRQQRRIPVRLVKGAYWDTEIKRAQEQGLADYPVFTRKAGDRYVLSRLRARAARAAKTRSFRNSPPTTRTRCRPSRFSQAAASDFEYQRLHGMGEALYELYRDVKKPEHGGAGTRIYAPVGTHEDLLAYLVRRLLENGANTSFVNRLADDEAPIAEIIADPVEQIAAPQAAPQRAYPEARRICLPGRKNSRGFVWSRSAVSAPMLAQMEAFACRAAACRANRWRRRRGRRVRCRARSVRPTRVVGEVIEASAADATDALRWRMRHMPAWDRLRRRGAGEDPRTRRRSVRGKPRALMALAVREAGKTLAKCAGRSARGGRFPALLRRARARAMFDGPTRCPARPAKTNELTLHGRGVFACISPWNFPLAIFTGAGRWRAGRRQYGAGKARGADAADRGGCREAAA